MKVIILAGGSGTRLWPISRSLYPKQFVKLQDSRYSLFQETFKRSLLLTSIDNIYVVTNDNYKELIMHDTKELNYDYNIQNIILEPEAKNTLPAIYAGVNDIVSRENDSIVVFPSDQMILKDEEFVDIILESEQLLNDSIVTFGIEPNSPNTGYGYISPGEKVLNGYEVKEFKEKPNYELAKQYVNSGYLWNGGIFMFNSNLFISEVEKYSPEIYNAFNTSESIKEAFSKITTKISIDFGVMEKTDKIVVVPVDIGWNDLGSFDSIYEVFPKDNNNNLINSDSVTFDSYNNYIYSTSNKLIAMIGIEDTIVVEHNDALLICNRNESQEIKKIVDELKINKDTIVDEFDSKKSDGIKNFVNHHIVRNGKQEIVVNKNVREHWIVIGGIVKLEYSNKNIILNSGESVVLYNEGNVLIENINDFDSQIIRVETK